MTDFIAEIRARLAARIRELAQDEDRAGLPATAAVWRECAAEIERPAGPAARLSDWVHAAEVSRLGRDVDPAHPNLTEVHLRWIDGLGMAVHTVEVSVVGALVFMRGALTEGCQTPAELTAALDKLAEEAACE